MLTASHGGYRASQSATSRKQAGLAINCFFATSIAMLSLSALLGHPNILTRPWTAADLLLSPFVLSGVRSILAKNLSAGDRTGATAGTLVVCYDYCSPDLISALSEQRISSRVSGVLYLARKHAPNTSLNWPVLPDIQTLLLMLRSNDVQDIVFIHHPKLDALAATRHQELLSDLLAFPARIWMAFDITANLPDMLKGRSSSYKLVPIVTDNLVSSLNVTKRAFDLIVAAALLFLAAPVLLVSACLVRISGSGPIIFQQIRIGAHGQQFTVLKFRTMTYEPERPFAQAQHLDPRVTAIGHFLRRTSLDELLQLINVLRGDMSLVGPRPHAPETRVEGITFENALRLYRLRHRVKPGITGLAQIRGQRGETRVLSMLEQQLASDLGVTFSPGRSGWTYPSCSKPCRYCSCRQMLGEAGPVARLRLVTGHRPGPDTYDADIMILSLNRPDETIDAIQSARAQRGGAFHVTVLDQGSEPDVVRTLARTFQRPLFRAV